jgi:hypothetical protein
MSTWPGTLPTAPMYGWTEVPGTSTIRTETDSGPAKTRRRFSSAPSQFSLQFAMTEAQATRLVQFYTNSIGDTPAGTAGGAETFGGLNHPRDNSDVPENELTGWRFLSPPTLTQNAFGRFNATVQLELLG